MQQENATPTASASKEEMSPVLDDAFYGNDEYLQLISSTNKNNARWIHSSLSLNDEANDEDELSSFEPSTSNESHPYLDDIREALSLFSEWQQDNEWRLNTTIKKDEESALRLYMNQNNRITKSTMLFPYSSPIIAGVFCNNEHYGGIDESILKSKILNEFDSNSYSVYVQRSQPFPFSSNRDLLMVRFCYILGAGEFLFGEKSIDDDDFVPDPEDENNVNGVIRAQGVNVWHCKPVPHQTNQSFITHYSSYNPNGAFSRFLQQKIIVHQGKFLVKLYDYLNEIRKILHTEGQLFIPLQLFDLLDINHESLASQAIGEDLEEDSDDDNIVDLNLAVTSVICDVKDFFNGIGKPQQK